MQTLRLEQRLEHGPRCIPKSQRIVIGACQERHGIDLERSILVAQIGQQYFARRNAAGANRLLDLSTIEARRIGQHEHVQPAGGRLVHLVGKLLEIARLEGIGRKRRQQFPGRRRHRQCPELGREQGQNEELRTHENPRVLPNARSKRRLSNHPNYICTGRDTKCCVICL
jgi:hypothetical protein